MDPLQHPVEILHGAEFLHDGPVVGDIVPVIVVGGGIYRRNPDHIDPQVLQVIKMGRNAVQVPDPVSV